jgi:hypothetical protein
MGGGIFSGPPPKRSEERRRVNKTTESGTRVEPEKHVVDPAVMADPTLVAAPDPNPKWHWLPLMQYEAARTSAIRDFYEPTDWAQLFFLCETLDMHLRDREVYNPLLEQFVTEAAEPINGAVIGALLKGFSALMFTDGDRRRLRLEIERVVPTAGPAAQPAGVTDIRSRRLGATS